MGHSHFCSAPSVGPIELLLGLGMCQAVLAAVWAAIAREEGPTVLRMISALTEQPRRAMCDAEAQAESSGLSSNACETRQTRLAIVLAQLRLEEAACHAQWLAQSECAVPPPAAQARAATEAQHTSSNRSTLRLFSIDIHTGVVAEVRRLQWVLHAGLLETVAKRAAAVMQTCAKGDRPTEPCGRVCAHGNLQQLLPQVPALCQLRSGPRGTAVLFGGCLAALRSCAAALAVNRLVPFGTLRAAAVGHRLQERRRFVPGAASHSPPLFRCVCLLAIAARSMSPVIVPYRSKASLECAPIHRATELRGYATGIAGTCWASGCETWTCSWYGRVSIARLTCWGRSHRCRLQCTTPLAMCQLYLPFNRSMLLLAPVAFHQVTSVQVSLALPNPASAFRRRRIGSTAIRNDVLLFRCMLSLPGAAAAGHVLRVGGPAACFVPRSDAPGRCQQPVRS